MISQFSSLWQSIIQVGTPIFPYIGLLFILILCVLIVAIFAYIVYKIVIRLPFAFRYVFWRVGRLFTRTPLANKTALPLRNNSLSCRWSNRSRIVTHKEFFPRLYPFFNVIKRPKCPLVLVLGASGAGKSEILEQAKGSARVKANLYSTESVDLTWWSFRSKLALEINGSFLGDAGADKRVQLKSLLHKWCPEQPFNSIIIVIELSKLIAQDVASTRVLIDLAQAVHEFVEVANGEVDVNILLSGLDEIPGAEAFVNTLSNKQKEELLVYRTTHPAALDEFKTGFIAWCSSIQCHAMRTISTAPETRISIDLYELLLLSKSIGSISTLLAEWLHTSMRRSQDGDACLQFNGAFFKGKKTSDKDFNTNAWLGPSNYLSDLSFTSGIYIRNTKQYNTWARQRLIYSSLILFSSIVIFALLLPNTVAGLKKASDSMQDPIGLVNAYKRHLITSEQAPSAERILKSVASLEELSFWTFFAPSSWGNNIVSTLLQSLGTTAAESLLNTKKSIVLQDNKIANEEPLSAITSVSAASYDVVPAFRVIDKILKQKAHSYAVGSLTTNQASDLTYADFMFLVSSDPIKVSNPDWVWNSPLPKEFILSFQRKSSDTLTPSIDSSRQDIDILWERFIKESIDLHPVSVLSNEVSMMIGKFANGNSWSYSETVTLIQKLAQLERQLNDNNVAARIASKPLEGQRFIDAAIARMVESQLVTPLQAGVLANQFINRRDVVRTQLLGLQPDSLGPMYVVDSGNERLVFSTEMKQFIAALASVTSMPFMQPTIVPSDIQLQDESFLVWDLDALEQLKDVGASYKSFLSQGVNQFSPRFRQSLQRVVRQQYRNYIDTQYASAARVSATKLDIGDVFNYSNTFRSQLFGLSSALKVYRQVVGTDEGFHNSNSALLLQRQTGNLLALMEQSLVKSDPYSELSEDIARWLSANEGSKPLISFVRGTAKERIIAPRELIRAHYIVPVVDLVDGIEALSFDTKGLSVLQRWRRLVELNQAVEKGEAGSSIFELEQYLFALFKLNNQDECEKFFSEKPPISTRSNYFTNRLTQLDELTSDLCKQRARELVARSYQGFAQWFNGQIAGHAPFVDDRKLPALSRRSFLMVLDSYRQMRQQLGITPPIYWPQQVRQFLAQMDVLVLRFLPPAVQKQVGGVSETPVQMSIQGKIEFRSLRSDSRLAEHIIDLSVVSGSKTYGLRNPKDAFEWRAGEPVEIRLRWAENSPYMPIPASDQSAPYTIEDRTVVFRYSGEWGLFDAIRSHSVKGDPTESLALRFDVAVVGPEKRSLSRVFLTLHAANESSPLVTDFPSLAPVLSSQNSSQLNKASSKIGR